MCKCMKLYEYILFPFNPNSRNPFKTTRPAASCSLLRSLRPSARLENLQRDLAGALHEVLLQPGVQEFHRQQTWPGARLPGCSPRKGISPWLNSSRTMISPKWWVSWEYDHQDYSKTNQKSPPNIFKNDDFTMKKKVLWGSNMIKYDHFLIKHVCNKDLKHGEPLGKKTPN